MNYYEEVQKVYQPAVTEGEAQDQRLTTMVSQFAELLPKPTGTPIEKIRWLRDGITVADPADAIDFRRADQHGSFTFAIGLDERFLHQCQVKVAFRFTTTGLEFHYGEAKGYENHAFETILKAIFNDLGFYLKTQKLSGSDVFIIRLPGKSIGFY